MSPLTVAMLTALHAADDVNAVEVQRSVRLWRQAGAPDLPVPEDTNTLSAWLRKCREALGFSQRLVAHQINRTQMQVCRWETAEAVPDAGELAMLFDVYQLSPEQRAEGLSRARQFHLSRVRR